MKKKIIFFALAAVTMASCKKSELQLNNPNAPTPTALNTLKGIEQFSLGMWNKLVSGNNLLTHSIVMHSIMGDEQFSSVGNWGWRYVDQVDWITLPNGTRVRNPLELSQPTQLKTLNTLPATNGSQTNAIVYEWNMAYYVNNQANMLLGAINSNVVTIPATEKALLTAWAYWWKGFAYSRLGSIYVSGIINNNTDGTTNNTYVGRDALIAEANSNFDKAITALTPIASISSTDAVYVSTMTAIIPSFNRTTPTVTPAMWIRDCNTYKARNILVNKKVSAMTAADWNNIKTLATAGLIQNDRTFVLGMDPGGVNDLSGGQQHPYQWNSYRSQPGWVYVSERWVQDFKANDARFTKGLTAFPAAEVVQNRSARGISYGTRYYLTPIENGGYWSTNNKQGQVQFAGSWEENALMLAEANIRTGAIEDGLGFIDAVRTANGAGLAAVKGTGMSLTDALEELRRERRVALFVRGLAFYDARRWNVVAPVSAGGGRANGNVVVPNSILGTTPAAGWTLLPCLIDYNYMEYWDVPVTEFAFNVPSSGSAPIAN